MQASGSNLRFIVALCAGLALPASAPAATINFFDGTFTPANWTLSTATLVNGGSAAASQVTSGGNPGDHRKIDLVVSAGGAGSAIFAYSLNQNAIWDPSVQGEILSLDYSEDGQLFLATGGATVSRGGPALLQGGTLYHYSAFNISNPSAWSLLSVTGATSTNFVQLGTSNHPDFTSTGSLITFGYLRANSTPSVVGYTTESGIDNWSLTLSVPEPALLALLLVGLAGLRLFQRS